MAFWLEVISLFIEKVDKNIAKANEQIG